MKKLSVLSVLFFITTICNAQIAEVKENETFRVENESSECSDSVTLKLSDTFFPSLGEKVVAKREVKNFLRLSIIVSLFLLIVSNILYDKKGSKQSSPFFLAIYSSIIIFHLVSVMSGGILDKPISLLIFAIFFTLSLVVLAYDPKNPHYVYPKISSMLYISIPLSMISLFV